MAKDDIGGVWRTVSGRRIFIKEGQDLATAMKESGKFKGSNKSKTQKSDFYNRLSKEEQEKYDNYLKKGYSKEDIENTLMYKTQEDRMEEAGIKFASKEETESLQNKANDVYKEYVKNTLNNDEYLQANRPNEYFQKMLREKDSELREETLKNLDANAKEAVKQGIDKNEFAQKNAERGINTTKSDEAYNKAQEKSLNSLRRKDEKILKNEYQQYLKEHPNSKLTFEDFKKW